MNNNTNIHNTRFQGTTLMYTCITGRKRWTEKWILDVLHPVNREGSYQSETKQNSDALPNTHSTVEDWRNLEKMK